MAHPKLLSDTGPRRGGYRTLLAVRQAELLSWLDDHLPAHVHALGLELAGRYVEIAERWGDILPSLRRSDLDRALDRSVPSIAPRDRWLTELPLAIAPGDRLVLGRLLRAVVDASRAQRH